MGGKRFPADRRTDGRLAEGELAPRRTENLQEEARKAKKGCGGMSRGIRKRRGVPCRVSVNGWKNAIMAMELLTIFWIRVAPACR